MLNRIRLLAATILSVAAVTPASAQSASRNSTQGLDVPIEYRTLANGLRVVTSRDTTAPTVAVAVYYNIGFRNEPRNRTGFAHLFEHMMFQGSANLGKLQFIKLVEGNGGLLNGSTRFDFTNYYQVIPSHALETVLWAEADRMHGLAIDASNLKNQQDVVKNEVKVNVMNQPYGSFPWIDLPMAANSNWYNAHNFYGDFEHLDAANLSDVKSFFRTYYAPNNAVLAIVGDFEPSAATKWVNKYFGPVARVPQPKKPNLSEPRQTSERRTSRTDSLATRPAVGLGYHVPTPWTPEWFAFGLLDQLLAQGSDALLYDELVRKRALTGSVDAGINYGLGNMYDYSGPMLWEIQMFHDVGTPPDSLLGAFDRVIESLRSSPVSRAALDRARVKIRSDLYANLESFSGFGKANLLASLALFYNDPARINRIESGFAAVTPEILQRTAREYLRKENRTIYLIVPGAKDKPAADKGASTQ